MAKSKKKKKNGGSGNNSSGGSGGGGSIQMLDPAVIRFQHARIRPTFSGCGRSVLETLEQIRNGQLNPQQGGGEGASLPMIQVLHNDVDGLYYSLNNRRLWVLKECRKEGLLVNEQVPVRIRSPKSQQERERYTVDKCSLEAKFMREQGGKQCKSSSISSSKQHDEESEALPNANEDSKEKKCNDEAVLPPSTTAHYGEAASAASSEEDSDDDDDSDSDDGAPRANPFSALF